MAGVARSSRHLALPAKGKRTYNFKKQDNGKYVFQIKVGERVVRSFRIGTEINETQITLLRATIGNAPEALDQLDALVTEMKELMAQT